MTGLIFKSVLMKLMTDLTDCYFVADVVCFVSDGSLTAFTVLLILPGPPETGMTL